MDNLPALMRRNTRFTLFFLSMGFLGLAIWPEREPVFGGFLVGVAGGYVMSLHLAWKVTSIGKLAAEGNARRAGSFSFLPRAAIGALAAFISVRYLAFDLPATVVGLLTGPLATLLLGIGTIRRPRDGHSSDERGEKQ